MDKVFCLNISTKEEIFLKQTTISLPSLPKVDKTIRQSEIDALISSGDNLDAESILDIVSPQGNFNVFISHYHENTEMAQNIAKILTKKGFKPFIDSQYWLHFDSVAEKLNNYHFHKDKHGEDIYDHNKTIMVQKHCDVLLLSALSKLMTRCKYFIFINPPKKFLGIKSYSKHNVNNPKTYSPWIYWELIFADMILKKSKTVLVEDEKRSDFSVPKVEYHLSIESTTKITISDIMNGSWINK